MNCFFLIFTGKYLFYKPSKEAINCYISSTDETDVN